MKRLIFFFLLSGLLSLNNTIKAQISFNYDDAGNCILKYKTVVISHAKKNITDTLAVEAQKEQIGDLEVLIYPNPTKGAFKINIKGSLPDCPFLFILTDLSGHIIARKETNESSYQYDMTNYPVGVYMLRVVIQGKSKDWKIVKE